jgi:hypothetical protein
MLYIYIYEGYPKSKYTTRGEGKGNHRRPSRSQHRPRSQRFPFVIALKKHLAGQKFHEDEEVKNEVTTWLRAQAAEFYDIGIQNLLPRLNKCIDKDGDYVEK